MTSSERVHFGLKWMGLAQGTSQLIRFVSTAILARLLVPEMFGLIAMAQVSIAMVGIVGEAGLASAFIQRRSEDQEDERLAVNTIFAVLVAISALLFGAAWLLIPTISRFFQSPEVDPILRVMFCVFLLTPFSTTARSVLQKRLDFGRLALCEITAGIGRVAVAIPMAATGFGVWSLVASHLAYELVRTGMLVRASGWRPGLPAAASIAREFFAYGKFLWAFAGLSAVGDSLDRLLTGRWLGAAQLGLYGMALDLARLPSTEIARLVNNIAFPSLALVQDQHETLVGQFQKALAHVSFLALPVGFGMLAVADDLILTIYGEKWLGAIPVFRILAFYGIALAVSSTTGPLFKATGRPQLLLYTSLVHHGLLLCMLLLLGRYGVTGIAVAVVVPMALSSVVAFVLIARIMEFGVAGMLGPVLRATICSVAMLAAVLAFGAALDARWELPVAVSLLLKTGLGMLAYLAFSALFHRTTLIDFARTVRSVVGAKGELA